ncbi:serine-rich adhesin for platelets isoform X2 [Pseudorasbora parva]
MFSPRAVQSSVSEVPVTWNFPEEVGSSLSANRPLKRLSLFQFVKGHVSSRPESTSPTQTTPSSSVLASLPLHLNEWQKGSLTSLQGSGSTITDTASVSTQGESSSFPVVPGTSGLSTSNRSSPSLYMSSSQENSDAKSAQATFVWSVYPQESLSNSSSSAAGASSISQGSPGSLSDGFGQSISSQGQSSYSHLSQSKSAQPQSTGPALPLVYQVSRFHSLLTQTQGPASPSQGSSMPELSLSSPHGDASQSSWKQFTSSYGTHSGPSMPLTLQGSTANGGSIQPQGTTSQFGHGSPSLSATVQSSRKQFTSSYGTQSGFSTPLTLQGSTAYGGPLQPHGTTSQFALGSPSSYSSASLSSPQGAVSLSLWKQFASSYDTKSGSSTPLTLQGSTAYGGSIQPHGTTSQFHPGSPSSYSGASSSPQGAASQSATVQSSRNQFTSNYGTQSGFSTPLTLQGSTAYGGSLQPQGTTSPFGSGSPSSYSSVSLSSPQGAVSLSSWKQLTSSFGIQSGFSTPLTLQGSAAYGGSLQPQGTTSPFGPGSPSSYSGVSLSSPQGAVSQSSWKQLTSSFGTQSGFSTPLTLQGSTAYGGSFQHQGTTSQFVPGSPSSYPSVSLSSPLGADSQAFQSSPVAQNQKSQSWPPSDGIQTSGEVVSQVSQSSPMRIRLSSLSLAGGSISRDPGQFGFAQGANNRSSGISLHSQSTSSKYTPGSHAKAKLGSSPLAVSSQSTSDQRSNGLYSSESHQTQSPWSLLGIVERPSRLSLLAPFDSPSSNQISERLVTSRSPTGSNLAQSQGLSAQASSVGMLSGILQTSQALHESGSNAQLYNKAGSNSRANASRYVKG